MQLEMYVLPGFPLRWRRSAFDRTQAICLAVGSLLIAAAVLKGLELAVSTLPFSVLTSPRWLVGVAIQVELILVSLALELASPSTSTGCRFWLFCHRNGLQRISGGNCEVAIMWLLW